MNENGDRRLIEDYLPIEAISAEASREKSVRKGHISTLHLWWARRPLVACRAAVYGSLVPASRFIAANATDSEKRLGREKVTEFVGKLCKYPGNPSIIAEAGKHVLDAHADRLARETGEKVNVEDIISGQAPRPKVLDIFAGGGAIPLEALRLGCDAYALDLNPVAHIIELCTLVYPQSLGKAHPAFRGMTGPKNEKGESTWGGLAEEVRYWGEWVLEKVKEDISDLYPTVPITDAARARQQFGSSQLVMAGPGFEREGQKEFAAEQIHGLLTPVAYLWTRTVRCKNPSCGATVPLVRQTWLCKSKGRYVAVRMLALRGEKRVKFDILQSTTAEGLGFDPNAFSKAGNATCPFCGTVADINYVKAEGCAGRLGHQMMALVREKNGGTGKFYEASDPTWEDYLSETKLLTRAEQAASAFGITIPDEPLEANPRSFDVQHFGFTKWRHVFTARQLVAMITFAGTVKAAHADMLRSGYDAEHAKGLVCCLSMVLGRTADYSTSFCTWQPEFIAHTFDTPGLPMIMDYAEANPLTDSSGSWLSALRYVEAVLVGLASVSHSAHVTRGSAFSTAWDDETFDAVVTDPPYYDSRSYSNLADHFYVWHKRAIGHLFPEHFASELTPKKNEAIAAPYRHGGIRRDANAAYESMMQKSFEEARRLLKPGAPMVCVYAHKTTAGWATLINSLRLAGFAVVEAWPIGMERKVRQNAQETAALASSILLVARKRESDVSSTYDLVRPEMERIIRERVETLWQMNIAGADLVIAGVGAGLRAFTQFAKVEYENGDEVPPERFLSEVEGVVLETLLERILDISRSGIAAVDAWSRFFVLWRYTYYTSEVEAGEAIVFAYPQGVELDGPKGLAAGPRALLSKKGNKYRLLDFTERGDDEKLGLPNEMMATPPLIDILHRALWLMEHRPTALSEFLDQARPNTDQLRLVAQALAGPSLQGGETRGGRSAEQVALGTMLANWKSLVEENLFRQQRQAKLGL